MRDSIFYDMLIEPFTKGFWFALMGVFMWLVALILVGLLSWGLFYIVDSVGLSEIEGSGIVVDGCFEPAHETTYFMQVGKIMVPQTIYHSDNWKLKIKIDGVYDYISVSESDYNSIKINQVIKCNYTTGRISDGIYIKKASW